MLIRQLLGRQGKSKVTLSYVLSSMEAVRESYPDDIEAIVRGEMAHKLATHILEDTEKVDWSRQMRPDLCGEEFSATTYLLRPAQVKNLIRDAFKAGMEARES